MKITIECLYFVYNNLRKYLDQSEDLGPQICRDRDPSSPLAMACLPFLTDKVTKINCPMHQFRPTENGFEAITAVYWPEHTPDEIVEGHSLHLAMEFYEGLKMAESM